jgi:hypothetical protein
MLRPSKCPNLETKQFTGGKRRCGVEDEELNALFAVEIRPILLEALSAKYIDKYATKYGMDLPSGLERCSIKIRHCS